MTEKLARRGRAVILVPIFWTLSLSAQDPSTVWVTLGKETYWSLAGESGAWDLPAVKTVRADGEVLVLEIPQADILLLAQAIHQRLGRCGGFFAHPDLETALTFLEPRQYPSNKAPDYFIDNESVAEALRDGVQGQELLNTIGTLSEFHNRFYTSESGVAASEWIRDKWAGLASGRNDVSVELVPHQDFPQPSVMLTVEGADLPDEYVVIGAHLDSINRIGTEVGRAPGADDDASGIATVTEVLRVMFELGYKPARNLVAIGYAAEEVGSLGSEEIAGSFRSYDRNVVGVLQLDMTAYKGSGDDIILVDDHTDPTQNQFIGELIDRYLKVRWGTTTCGYACSDHASWTHFGYPASFPFEAYFGQHNHHIHSQADTIESFGNSADHALNFARLAAVYLAETAKGTLGNTNLSAALPVKGRIPHITGEAGNFITDIILVNTGATDRAYSLTPFGADGSEGITQNGTVAAGTTERFTAGQKFETHPAHLTVGAEDDLLVSVAYRANVPGSSPAHSYQSLDQARVWRLFPGDWSVVWDGFAAVNTGAIPTVVHVRQIGENGAVLVSTTAAEALAPNAKVLYVIRDHFEDEPGCHYAIQAEQPLAFTALRGNLGSQLLWVNPAAANNRETEKATYQVTFQSEWSVQTHPEGFPANPHFSGLIGATHHAGAEFWQEGGPASPGIENMAETGSKQALTSEIEAAIIAGNAEQVLSGSGIAVSPGSVTLTFEISEKFPLVTLVTMLAPSPDWFVGVSGLRLFENGAWLEQKTVGLYVFDAGTDSGATYSAPNQDTQPREPIFRIPTTPFLRENKTPPIGTFTFTKM